MYCLISECPTFHIRVNYYIGHTYNAPSTIHNVVRSHAAIVPISFFVMSGSVLLIEAAKKMERRRWKEDGEKEVIVNVL